MAAVLDYKFFKGFIHRLHCIEAHQLVVICIRWVHDCSHIGCIIHTKS